MCEKSKPNVFNFSISHVHFLDTRELLIDPLTLLYRDRMILQQTWLLCFCLPPPSPTSLLVVVLGEKIVGWTASRLLIQLAEGWLTGWLVYLRRGDIFVVRPGIYLVGTFMLWSMPFCLHTSTVLNRPGPFNADAWSHLSFDTINWSRFALWHHWRHKLKSNSLPSSIV